MTYQHHGRNTVFYKGIAQKARDYVESVLSGETRLKEVVPTYEGIAVYLGVSKRTLEKWRDGELPEDLKKEENKEELDDLLNTFSLVKDLQALVLLNRGLDKTFDSTTTAILLSNHGYVRKTESDLTTKGQSINLSALDAEIINTYLSKRNA